MASSPAPGACVWRAGAAHSQGVVVLDGRRVRSRRAVVGRQRGALVQNRGPDGVVASGARERPVREWHTCRRVSPREDAGGDMSSVAGDTTTLCRARRPASTGTSGAPEGTTHKGAWSSEETTRAKMRRRRAKMQGTGSDRRARKRLAEPIHRAHTRLAYLEEG